MRKQIFLVAAVVTSTWASSLMVANAQSVVIKSCAVRVSDLAATGLTGAALDDAARKLAVSLVEAAPVAPDTGGCIQSIAQLAISPELKASLLAIIVALGSGTPLPPLAASAA